jgi:hypothetical protein
MHTYCTKVITKVASYSWGQKFADSSVCDSFRAEDCPSQQKNVYYIHRSWLQHVSAGIGNRQIMQLILRMINAASNAFNRNEI